MKASTIRSATSSDGAAIAELLTQLGYPATAEEATDRLNYYHSGGAVFVAEIDGDVAGFASFHAIPLMHADGCLGRITAMCVRSDHRRSGIGRGILDAIHRHALQAGCSRIEVTSGDHRVDDAHRFYESCGYKTSDRRFQKSLV